MARERAEVDVRVGALQQRAGLVGQPLRVVVEVAGVAQVLHQVPDREAGGVVAGEHAGEQVAQLP